MLETRRNTRPEHVAFLEDLGQALVFAGPFLDRDENPNGSLVVIEAENLQEAKKIVADDPYTRADLFSNVDIRPWVWSLNNGEGR